MERNANDDMGRGMDGQAHSMSRQVVSQSRQLAGVIQASANGHKRLFVYPGERLHKTRVADIQCFNSPALRDFSAQRPLEW